jgi:nitrogenase molybdenum-iron protein alpha/beta subunit
MAFGFECGDGWFRLIDQLSSDITAIDKRDGTETIAFQVKEKYGGLRFYIEGGSDAVFDAIDKAEELSLKTCEVCGEPGKQRGKGWIYTMCDKCWEKDEKETR